MSQQFSISELSREFDVTTRTIRFYEAEGLLHPTRKGQTRIYSDADRVTLKLIIRGKRLGLSLAESKELIQLYDPSGANQVQLRRLLDKINERRQVLKQQVEDIRVMQLELDEAESRCIDAINKQKT
ncbi:MULTISPECIES: MerR family DNA-binding transcriptional regulator [unclassified Oleiphilus]|uniref:MerR family transcriptional regulator n=2 Tax=Oleiphilus TaxID=141450 RepID=UPI0007C28521|nr:MULTISPECIES: MerR family DNA-binding transcriptional regulator [unclassified Oleiphilus]KZY48445.1 MerR family transcriptional regulator [Oleiphilus sp. HI0050]KZY78073.1 MerR family transcriptional regulator [Oleiphilus sp. HI0068]KZY80984.1 MerR family transcriptional regulator [Oleiphilus sp. HI0069]KZY84938.1 MerR family transcriptional regulator [Oleiphilus sp. HI0072]KZZ20962.1 MerR family transcriptional regulator [Oleiphilus sp. HI0078]KZZ20972.1 MerR family transcriptional regula